MHRAQCKLFAVYPALSVRTVCDTLLQRQCVYKGIQDRLHGSSMLFGCCGREAGLQVLLRSIGWTLVPTSTGPTPFMGAPQTYTCPSLLR